MNAREEGFLLLTSQLGNPERKCLTTAQLRTLAQRIAAADRPMQDRELTATDLSALGYGKEMASRIAALLQETDLLRHYLHKGNRVGCVPITRATEGYPIHLRQKLGLDSPGVLWAKGDLSLLEKPAIALVGNREIFPENAAFAEKAGSECAMQGFVLISGNARGADRIAQNACLKAGGQVISIVADELIRQPQNPNVLYLSEEGYDSAFTSVRALSRNRVIHALGVKTFVAQCSEGKGGTWSGTVKNLRNGWSDVFAFRDGSVAMIQLEQMGASMIGMEELESFYDLRITDMIFLDR